MFFETLELKYFAMTEDGHPVGHPEWHREYFHKTAHIGRKAEQYSHHLHQNQMKMSPDELAGGHRKAYRKHTAVALFHRQGADIAQQSKNEKAAHLHSAQAGIHSRLATHHKTGKFDPDYFG